MFRKLTYLMMLILIGVGSAFGQVSGTWTWNSSGGGNIADLVTIDQNLLDYKATASTGSVNVKINGTTYTTYETAIAAVYGQLVAHGSTTFPTGDVTGTTVVNLNGATVNVTSAYSISGTLVLVGSGTVNFSDAAGVINLTGSLFLQGNVVLDGNRINRQRALVKGTNGGKLYMADNATIQNCVNNTSVNSGSDGQSQSAANSNITKCGGAVYLIGSSNSNRAQLNMVGGVIGDNSNSVAMVKSAAGTTHPVYNDPEHPEIHCAIYTLNSPNGNKAPIGGGVLLNEYATANLNGGTIRGNEATVWGNGSWFGGGGIMAWSATTKVNVHGNTVIAYNLATNGAGINMTHESSLDLDGGLFEWNCACISKTTQQSGCNMAGGISIHGGTQTIAGGEFRYNRALFGASALKVYGKADAVISNIHAHHNYTCGRSTIHVEAADAHILSGEIHDNIAQWGGAVICTKTTAPIPGSNFTVTVGQNDGTGPEIYNNRAIYNFGAMPVTGGKDYGGVGGAFCLDELNMDVLGGHFYNNEADVAGGAIFINGGECKLEGGNFGINPNTNAVSGNKALGVNALASQDAINANGDGGAVYVMNNKGTTKKTTISGNVMIKGNTAVRNGGALYIASGEVDINGGTFDGNQALGTAVEMNGSSGGNGGGMYVASTIETDMAGGTLINNVAANNGGGLYLKSTFNMTGGSSGTSSSDGNIATNGNGGGVYVDANTTGNALTVNSGTFSGNKALKGNGGGFYVASGNVELIERTGQTPADVITINNVNEAKNGGGFFVNGGTITITGAEISGNKATAIGDNSGNGGGVYSNGGVLTINDGDIAANEADINGGGFYVNGGELKLEGGTIGSSDHPNDAVNGGGFYIQGGSSKIEGGTVQYNTATNGAGLYMKGTSDSNKATATFSDGTFTQNTASSAGGGIYIDDYAELTMKGNSQITNNTATSAGGGVYKRGETKSLVLVNGSGSSESAELKIYNNTVNGKANNLYLDQYDDFLTIDPAGGLPQKMQLGVSVNTTTAGDKPLPTRVIHCTNFNILNSVFMKLMEAFNQTHPSRDEEYSFISDDAERFLPVFASSPEPFTFEYIFFAEVWPSPFDEVPATFDLGNISKPDELTFFMMVANNIRCEAWKEAHPLTPRDKIEGNVVADIDMSGRFWIPIGGFQATPSSEKLPYSGTFHGNGHTISGLESIGLTGTSIYGLFGDTQGATIENVNLTDSKLTSGQADYFGMLVGRMTNGEVLNCIVGGTLDASGSGDGNSHSGQNDGGFIGGLIGGTFGNAHIKNVISTVDIVAEFHKDSDGNYDNNRYIEDSRTVGGLVGITSAGTVIENGFANPKIEHGSWFPRYVGGLVGYNEGALTNCYVRLGRGVTLNIGPGYTEFDYNEHHYVYPSGTKSLFGMFAGYNGGNISYCYAPNTTLFNTDHTYVHTSASGDNRLTNYGDYDAVVRPYTYTSYLKDNKVTMVNGTSKGDYLIDALNAWVEDANDASYSHWMRTKASEVNDDYPVLSFDNIISTLNYTTIGSKGGYDLDYDNRFKEVYGRIEEAGEGCLFVYRTPWDKNELGNIVPEIITADNTASDNHISIYVEEDVALLQSGTERTLKNVFTCQVLKTQDGAQCWHTVASSLTGSKIGFDYGTETQVTWNEDTNPCNVTLAGSANSIFPTGTPIESLDLYSFYEPQYHWVNLKRNQQSHWHMNSTGTQITYDKTLDCGYGDSYFTDNDKYDGTSTLVSGKGYLASIDKDMLIQGDGELTNGEVTVPVTVCAGDFNTTSVPAIPANEGTELKGYNLLGNPYQSYLSFARFAEVNGTLWSESTTPSYAVFDAESGFYIPGTAAETSKGSFAAQGDINMHQGFFIVADNPGTAKFDNTMRSNVPLSGTHFRGEELAYPLVNLVVTDATGTGDVAVVELDRPEYKAAAKMKHIGADGKIYFHHNGGDQALLFLDEPTDHLPVHFEAIADGTYTMTWSTANADFSYLHLIDNVAGMDIDMLTSESYTFTATTDDYKSRFKLMFAYTGIDENEDTELAEVFAFVHDGNLIVNGEGMLEVIDMCGRCIVNTELTDAQNTVSLPQTASGLYVLRLINDNKSKVQKIVVR